MKYSRIAMSVWLGLIFITLVSGLGIARCKVGDLGLNGSRNIDLRRVPKSDWSSWEQDLGNIDSISLKGSWIVTIVEGDEPHLKVSAPGQDYWSADSQGNTLVLTSQWLKEKEPYQAEITLKQLIQLEQEGAVDFLIENFSLNQLIIFNEGAGNLDARNSSIGYLQIENNGALNVNFKDTPVHDAVIEMNGAGNVELLMDGGILDVTINGMGGVKYRGSVSDKNVNINGLGKVSEIK